MKNNIFIVFVAVCALAFAAIASPSFAQSGEVGGLAGLEQLKPFAARFTGSIAAVKGADIYISNDSGITPPKNTVLTIKREKEPVINPATGEKIGAVYETAGAAKVVSGGGKMVVAAMSGKGKVKPGYIAESFSGSKETAVVFSIKTKSGDSGSAESVKNSATETISGWDGVSVMPQSRVERFVHDAGLTNAGSIISGDTLKRAKETLGADYLVFIEVKEGDGGLLTDFRLYDLASGAMLNEFKGFEGATKVESVKKEAEVKPEPVAKAELEQKAEPASKEAVKPVPAKETQLKQGFSGKTLGRFAEKLTALYACDLDGGGKELIAGFGSKLVIFKVEGDALKKIWEKELGARSEITGICAGDFRQKGSPDIYVNNVMSGAARSFIVKRDGASYAIMKEGMRKFFTCGSDGGLYSQGQKNDLSLQDLLMSATWSNGELVEKPFMELPAQRRLSGINVFDVDSDGTADVVGLDMDRKIVYHSSSVNDWISIDGEFGGSEMNIRLPDEGEMEVHHELQPQVMNAAGERKFPNIAAVHNIYSFSALSPLPRYNKSQVHLLTNNGLGYAIKSSTPVGEGVMNAIAPYERGSFITGRSQSGYLGASKSEIILIEMDER